MANGLESDIFGIIYDKNGNELVSEFTINSKTEKSQFAHSVQKIGEDRFAITWTSGDRHFSTDQDILAQVFDMGGNKIGSEFQVNTFDQKLVAILFL